MKPSTGTFYRIIMSKPHLYDLFSSSDAEGGGGKEGGNNKPPAIAWLPHDHSWIIRDKKDFMLKKIIPSRHHFNVSK